MTQAAEIPRDVTVPAANHSVSFVMASKPAKVRHTTDVGTAQHYTQSATH